MQPLAHNLEWYPLARRRCSPVTATTGKLAIFREQVGDVPSAVNYRDDLHLLEATTVR